MNSMIENLVIDMRALGIKSLAIELSDSDLPPIDRERETLPPGTIADPSEPSDTEPPKDPKLCVAPGCSEDAGGIFGGIARHLCRSHAMQQAGVKA